MTLPANGRITLYGWFRPGQRVASSGRSQPSQFRSTV
jgi:hypothetical protein